MAEREPLNAAAEFCRTTAAPPGSTLHYATLFHAAAERRSLHVLFALRSEILAIDARATDATVAAMRRGWWQEELARVEQGVPRHPIGMELLQLPRAALPQGMAPLQRFAGGTGSAGLWRATAACCGIEDESAQEPVCRAGLLIDRLDCARGGPYAAATATPLRAAELSALCAELERARDELAAAPAARAEFCLILAAIGAAQCAEMARDPDVLAHSIVALTPLRKLWLAWRWHRRARKLR